MRPSRRGLLAGVAASLAAPLAGCGFRPLNLPPEPGEAGFAPQLAAVRLGRNTGRQGQLIHQALERRLAARDRSAPAARYELVVTPSLAIESQGFRRDGSPSRFRMTMNAPWTLSTLAVPPQQIARGSARAFDNYNFLDNEFYASIISSEAAERRLVEQVADDIVLRLALTFRDNPSA